LKTYSFNLVNTM